MSSVCLIHGVEVAVEVAVGSVIITSSVVVDVKDPEPVEAEGRDPDPPVADEGDGGGGAWLCTNAS